MTRISVEEYRALLKKRGNKSDKAALIPEPPRPSKYHNVKSEYYDPDLRETIKFDSRRELEYYLILKSRQKRGEIVDLRRQVSITIQPAFAFKGKTIREITYRADFVYIDKRDGLPHIIDVKGSKETLTEVYKLKRKLLLYQGYEIEEVY